MLVKNYMTRHPITIGPQQRLFEAQHVMSENGIRHLPVVGPGKRLLGIVTRQRLQIAPDRLASLDVWEITRYLSDLRVEHVMVKGPDLITIHPDATLEEAAMVMVHNRVGSLPVVEEGVVVGIITETDLLVELQNLLGAGEEGLRVTMRVPDRMGEFAKISAAMASKGWGIMAMGSSRSPKDPEKWDVVFKVRRCTEEELVPVLQSIGDQEIIDIRAAVISTT